VENKPGELAKICEALGNNGVNIKAIASERHHSRPQIRIVTDDEATTQSLLKKTGVTFELKNVITVRLSDQQGERHDRDGTNGRQPEESQGGLEVGPDRR
jgi:hypothetical protein